LRKIRAINSSNRIKELNSKGKLGNNSNRVNIIKLNLEKENEDPL
jgi:hypothetical protein